MNELEIKMPPSNIGRMAEIRVNGKILAGNVLDLVSRTNSPKRIRIQHGDPKLKGIVVAPGEYDFIVWCDDDSM